MANVKRPPVIIRRNAKTDTREMTFGERAMQNLRQFSEMPALTQIIVVGGALAGIGMVIFTWMSRKKEE